MTLAEWEKGVVNALVAIDRSGNPLHFAITPTTLSALPEHTVRQVANIVQSAINRYYKVNTRRGCTNPDAANFDFNANLDDSMCQLGATNFTFGGVFQMCTPDSEHMTEDLCTTGPNPARQVNPLTGDFNCPPGYLAVHLHSGLVSHVVQKPVCHTVCKRCHVWKRCCHCDNVLTPYLSIASYQAYWCAALDSTLSHRGYLFGGYYTSKASNPVTDSMSCPRSFYPLHMLEDMKVCVSTDYERGFAYAVDFAGFDTCSVGNPLAYSAPSIHNQAHWPQVCPHGYAQHLVAVEDGCEINVCLRAGAFKSNTLYTPRLPPFRKRPRYKNNVTNTLVMFGVYGQVWVKNDEGGWEKTESVSESGKSLLSRLDLKPSESYSSEDLPGGAVAAISIVVTLVLGVVVVAIVFVGRRVFKLRKGAKIRNSGSYISISDSTDEPGDNVAEGSSSPQPV